MRDSSCEKRSVTEVAVRCGCSQPVKKGPPPTTSKIMRIDRRRLSTSRHCQEPRGCRGRRSGEFASNRWVRGQTGGVPSGRPIFQEAKGNGGDRTICQGLGIDQDENHMTVRQEIADGLERTPEGVQAEEGRKEFLSKNTRAIEKALERASQKSPRRSLIPG